MVESKVTRIGGTLFARIPADEARRLGLEADTPVDIEVRALRRSARDVLRYKGAFHGQLAKGRRKDLWGE